jgi:hypothetical protein
MGKSTWAGYGVRPASGRHNLSLAACRKKTSEVSGNISGNIVTLIIRLICWRNHTQKLPNSSGTDLSDRLLDQTLSDMDMDLYEATSHPFIVRIWLEETADEAGRATWRGHITHVPSGKRQYLQDLDDIITFIAPYLAGMGVKLGLGWQITRRLKRWKLSLM